jgi:hypothetical protein
VFCVTQQTYYNVPLTVLDVSENANMNGTIGDDLILTAPSLAYISIKGACVCACVRVSCVVCHVMTLGAMPPSSACVHGCRQQTDAAEREFHAQLVRIGQQQHGHRRSASLLLPVS